MNLARGSGLWLRTDRYPPLPECPFCHRTNVPVTTKQQKTCGNYNCKREQGKVKQRRLKAKQDARKAA
jgi:hypothetical protein